LRTHGKIYSFEITSGLRERRSVYSDLVWKPEGKRPLVRPRRRWEDNIKMDLQEIECGCMEWIDLVQERDRWRTVANVVINF
jgi:hypothetical protein